MRACVRVHVRTKRKKDPVSQVNQIAGTKPEVSAKRHQQSDKMAFILKATGGTLLGYRHAFGHFVINPLSSVNMAFGVCFKVDPGERDGKGGRIHNAFT